MIELGVANYCDAIGIHAYVDQLDDARFRAPWDWLRGVGAKKPVSISEGGAPLRTDWGPKEMTDVAWRERWHALAYLQAKRFGYSRYLLFTNDGGDAWTDQWAYRDRHKNQAPIETAYSAVKNGMTKRVWNVAGFETPNDARMEWIPIGPINAPRDPDWADFAAKTARSGKQSLHIPATFTARYVKRIAPDLKPGKRTTVTAWVQTEGHGEAILQAQGWNRTGGLDERAQSKKSVGKWTRLRVSFVPTNPWAVVSLGAKASAQGAVWFDDVSIEQD